MPTINAHKAAVVCAPQALLRNGRSMYSSVKAARATLALSTSARIAPSSSHPSSSGNTSSGQCHR